MSPRQAPSRATTISTTGVDLDVEQSPSSGAPIVTKARRRRKVQQPSIPLGSLTQASYRPRQVCSNCGSGRITQLCITVDGEPMDFLSCHRCEHRSWGSAGTAVSVDTVIDRASKA